MEIIYCLNTNDECMVLSPSDNVTASNPPHTSNILKDWYNGFLKSECYNRMSDDEKLCGEEIINDFSYYSWFYHDCLPEEWTHETLELTLFNDYPRSLVHNEQYIASIPMVLAGFFYYLESAHHVNDANLLYSKMCEITDSFYIQMDDTRLWGPQKAFLYMALAAGVKGTEEDSIYRFVYRFIQNQVPGKDEQTILSLSHILYYWLFPFSDSKQLANLDPGSYEHCATIISKLMTNLVVRSGIPPQEWTSSDISREITDHLMITFQNNDQFEYIIPVLTAFFSFLSEKQLQPHADEIFQDLSDNEGVF